MQQGPEPAAAFRECQAEMEEKRGRQPPGDQISPVDDLVEVVELAGVVKAGKDEGDQAEQEEVPRLLRAAAAKIYKEPDGEIGRPHQILKIDRRIVRGLAHDDFGGELDAVSAHDIVLRRPGAHARQNARDIQSLCNRGGVDPDQHVAGVEAGFLGASAPGDAIGTDRVNGVRGSGSSEVGSGVDPGDSVVRQPEPVNLLKIHCRGDDGGDRNHRQHRRGDLKFQLLKHLGTQPPMGSEQQFNCQPTTTASAFVYSSLPGASRQISAFP